VWFYCTTIARAFERDYLSRFCDGRDCDGKESVYVELDEWTDGWWFRLIQRVSCFLHVHVRDSANAVFSLVCRLTIFYHLQDHLYASNIHFNKTHIQNESDSSTSKSNILMNRLVD
jgi:hypothetical protein